MSQAKSLVIIHAVADEKEVVEFGKHLAPLESSGELRVWKSLNVPPGSNRFEAIKEALKDADMVVFWVSVDLWTENDEFDFVLENKEIIPPNAQVVPLIARSANWESVSFLKQDASNAIPFDKQPIPSGGKEGQDAWMDGVTHSIAEKLGLMRGKAVSSKSFWKKITPDGWTGMGLAVILTILTSLFAYYLGNPSREKDTKELELQKNQKEHSLDSGCDFPAHFVRDTLYVLITRFEDFENENDTECYGRNIERRIDRLVQNHKLPIRFCYRDDLCPNQDFVADNFMRKFHADLIIWGLLHNAGPNCNADGFCLQFNPSDTLINYVGGEFRRPKLNEYQKRISALDIENGLIRMGNEIFDDWLIGLFNLKIGQQNPELFVIDEHWENEKKASAYITRGESWSKLERHDKAVSDFSAAIKFEPNNLKPYLLRGKSLLFLNSDEKALEDFQKYYNDFLILSESSLESDLMLQYMVRAEKNLDQNNYSKAVKDFTCAIQKSEKVKKISSVINFEYKKNDLSDSIEAEIQKIPKEHFSIASEIFEVALQGRAIANLELGLINESVNDFLQSNTDSATIAAYFFLDGVDKCNTKQYIEAENLFSQAINFEPKELRFYQYRANVKIKSGQYFGAFFDFTISLPWWFKLFLIFFLLFTFAIRKFLFREISQFLKVCYFFLTRLFQTLKKALHRP